MTAPATDPHSVTRTAPAGLLLRLAGVLSAYGTDTAFTRRGTQPHPTRSALIGMFAAAAGRPRDQALGPLDLPGRPSYTDLAFTIRVDAPGTPHTDFHTTGSARPRHEQLRTSKGGRRPEGKTTHVTRRHYLADACFTVAVHGPDALITYLAHTLEHPHFAPYLGRRACVPDEPLVLTPPLTDPLTHLLHHAPLTLPTPPDPDDDHIPVTVWWDTPPARPATHRELADEPVDFTPHRRRHTVRSRWTTIEHLPATLYAGTDPLPALAAYRHRLEEPCPLPP
ncbi:type I-E CRISPR-associated protein Cas5/CasD [Streptomyces sp. NPDC056683]|uniref:type I-E CRISPR-associated protein Cas5/CasD n=1 Tax=Streptomyces sp. NPDC056683 TaxID=3345910 RepID=UPI0036B14EF7